MQWKSPYTELYAAGTDVDIFLPANKSQVGRSFSAAAHIELLQNIVNMVLDRSHFNDKMLGDLVIGKPLADEFQYFHFS